jgi:uncharacterized protein involved in exopolysaccharide biosynthesis
MRNRFAPERSQGPTFNVGSGMSNRIREMSWLDLPPLLWKRRLNLSLAVCIVVACTAAVTLILPNKYRSSASILPSGDVDQFSDIKSLVGLGAPSAASQNSSMLFPVILESKTVRDAVANKTYTYSEDGVRQTVRLQDYLGATNPDRLRMKLARITFVSQDKKTGVISIETETKSPALSQAILQTYLDELESFNMHKRRSQAHENAVYLERQMTEKEAVLHAAEDSLEQFQKVNRGWMGTSDPELGKIVSRMQRDVDILSQAYLYLRQQYEVALFEAQKDVPIVRILDNPSLPTMKSGPRRLLIIFTAAVAAFFGTIFWILMVDVRGQKPTAAENAAAEASSPAEVRSVRLRRGTETRDRAGISS